LIPDYGPNVPSSNTQISVDAQIQTIIANIKAEYALKTILETKICQANYYVFVKF
jgi:hypothetical protein